MIDQIKNKTLNSSVTNTTKESQNTNVQKSVVNKVDNTTKKDVSNDNGKVSQFITKEKIKSMSKEPPIDKASTSRIKEAIKNGNYPVDLAKVADALFDAYKEMK
tara:strand:- start:253 stop:564 length:312 start_codon:yes stop_codon:yes gene_type:complete